MKSIEKRIIVFENGSIGKRVSELGTPACDGLGHSDASSLPKL